MNLSHVNERIDFVSQNIDLLHAEYSSKDIDEKFLFVAKCIAMNINVLKRLLKSTYDVLPWEEIEFCLVSFISSHVKQQDINFFYNYILNKRKILKYLKNFSARLEDVKAKLTDGVDLDMFVELPNFKREKVVTKLVENYPEFNELCKDFQEIRDIYSLFKIIDYIKLSNQSNPKQREGQFIIIRTLHILSEHLKNTLEAPNLSSTSNELLLLALPKATRAVIMDLRNSLSHGDRLYKKTELEDNETSFFIGLQNDFKIIKNVATDLLCKNKVKVIRLLLKRVIDCENIDDLKDIKAIAREVNVGLHDLYEDINKELAHEYELVNKVTNELNDSMPGKANCKVLRGLFGEIDKILNTAKANARNKFDSAVTISGFMELCFMLKNLDVGKFDVKEIKKCANKVLEIMPSQNIKPEELKTIAESCKKIYQISCLRDVTNCNVTSLTCKIFYFAELAVEDRKWINDLRDRLNERGSFLPLCRENKPHNVTEGNYYEQLDLKLSELKCIVAKNDLSGKEILQSLRIVIEVLVLDILVILDGLELIENNLNFFEDDVPVLTGKCLLEYLAHGSPLSDVILVDPSADVISNAKQVILENLGMKKIGKLLLDDPEKLKEKFGQSLMTIATQEEMFTALKEGNLEDLKLSIEKGADIHSKNIQLSTALHLATPKCSLEMFNFIRDQGIDVNAKDIDGQNVFHIAAAQGRKDIMEFLLHNANVSIDDEDNTGKVPLHIAAKNGHKDAVDFLLKQKAEINIKDKAGLTPLFYAIRNNHIDVVKTILDGETNVNFCVAPRRAACLHVASEYGCLEIVNFLLTKGANVKLKTAEGAIPLHIASMGGHDDVVDALIANGSDVNAITSHDMTSLHFAVKSGNEKVVELLLKNGAKTNIRSVTSGATPLYFAAQMGLENIVKVLLKHKVDANICAVDGGTPLHAAICAGHYETVTALLKHGVNIHIKDLTGSTPLHLAAADGHKEIALTLIKNGAIVNDEAQWGLTPLHLASRKGHKELVDLLIENNADVEALVNTGWTPIHFAASSGTKDVIELLIKNKANFNAKVSNGLTAVHLATLRGNEETVAALIKGRANVNAACNNGRTPLHFAALGGHKNIVELLVNNKAKGNVEGTKYTPLHAAIDGGNKEIVQILLDNKARVDAYNNSQTPLLNAVMFYNKDIVERLLANGAKANDKVAEPLLMAALTGFTDVLEILVKYGARVNLKSPDNGTALYMAAWRGYKDMVKVLIAKGAIVNVVTNINATTPLFAAAKEGHDGVVEILIANKANIHLMNTECTPLHAAAEGGHVNVVKVLLKNGAKINAKDNNGRTVLHAVVERGNMKIVKILLQHKDTDINAEGHHDITILHIAARKGDFEMVKFLVDKGCNMNAEDFNGLKPIHAAAKDIVKFFISKGLSVNELGLKHKYTVLHCAAMGNHIEVARYLITQDADLNPEDTKGATPLSMAAELGFKEFIEVLLLYGATCNTSDKILKRILARSDNTAVTDILESTAGLLKAVKLNNAVDVKKYLNAGGIVNAKDPAGETALHYASLKGYKDIVTILLKAKANPNLLNNQKCTPLHYAAILSHKEIVTALLAHGAMYNPVSDAGKTPVDLTEDSSIRCLFQLVRDTFQSVKQGNLQVISSLNMIQDVDTIKAIMGAQDENSKSLIAAAILCKFPNVKQLKEIFQGNVFEEIEAARFLMGHGQFESSLHIFLAVLKKRKEILGEDNPGTLDIERYIADVFYEQGSYHKALNMYESIAQRQSDVVGLDDIDTLNTRSKIASVLYELGRNDKALEIFREVCKKEEELLGPTHLSTLNTLHYMALVLDNQGKCDEALSLNRAVLVKFKEIGRDNDALNVQNNIGMCLCHQRKFEESIKTYKEVYEKFKTTFGEHNDNTLSILQNIADVYSKQDKYDKARKILQDVVNIRKQKLPKNHPHTLLAQFHLAYVYCEQGNAIESLEIYRDIFDKLKETFGPDHQTVKDASKTMTMLTERLQAVNAQELIHKEKQNRLKAAVNKNDVKAIGLLLNEGADVNTKDNDGRTCLHYAVNNGRIDIIDLLIKNGADVTEVTNNGNTPLHTATSKGHKEIIDILLKNVSRDKLSGFINAKTFSGGNTVLHVASKAGLFDIVQTLLEHGAQFDAKNNENKIPLELAEDNQVIINFLKFLGACSETQRGDVASVNEQAEIS